MTEFLSMNQRERLAMLTEEAGEISQAVGKVLRHGYESNYNDGPTNRVQLRNELIDIMAIYYIMRHNNDIEYIHDHEISDAVDIKLKWMQYNNTLEPFDKWQ